MPSFLKMKKCGKGSENFLYGLRVSEVKVITMFEAFLKPIESALFSLDYNLLLTQRAADMTAW